jgi:hypothetical protein
LMDCKAQETIQMFQRQQTSCCCIHHKEHIASTLVVMSLSLTSCIQIKRNSCRSAVGEDDFDQFLKGELLH